MSQSSEILLDTITPDFKSNVRDNRSRTNDDYTFEKVYQNTHRSKDEWENDPLPTREAPGNSDTRNKFEDDGRRVDHDESAPETDAKDYDREVEQDDNETPQKDDSSKQNATNGISPIAQEVQNPAHLNVMTKATDKLETDEDAQITVTVGVDGLNREVTSQQAKTELNLNQGQNPNSSEPSIQVQTITTQEANTKQQSTGETLVETLQNKSQSELASAQQDNKPSQSTAEAAINSAHGINSESNAEKLKQNPSDPALTTNVASAATKDIQLPATAKPPITVPGIEVANAAHALRNDKRTQGKPENAIVTGSTPLNSSAKKGASASVQADVSQTNNGQAAQDPQIQSLDKTQSSIEGSFATASTLSESDKTTSQAASIQHPEQTAGQIVGLSTTAPGEDVASLRSADQGASSAKPNAAPNLTNNPNTNQGSQQNNTGQQNANDQTPPRQPGINQPSAPQTQTIATPLPDTGLPVDPLLNQGTSPIQPLTPANAAETAVRAPAAPIEATIDVDADSQNIAAPRLDQNQQSKTVNTSGFRLTLQQAQHVQSQIAVQVASQFKNGISKFDIRLDPAELGKIEVQLQIAKDGKVQALLSADQQDTLDLLQRDQKFLQKSLNEAGLNLDDENLQFELNEHAQKDSSEGSNNNGSATEFSEDDSIISDQNIENMLSPLHEVETYGFKLTQRIGVNIAV